VNAPLSNKVLTKAASAFRGEEIEQVLEALALYGTESFEREPERVRLAILNLSEGDYDRLCHFVDSAKSDYRDVLYWTEYGGENSSAKAKNGGVAK
jgi:hypothetical protein